MDARYSEALERQLEQIQYWQSEGGWIRAKQLTPLLKQLRRAGPDPKSIRDMRLRELEKAETFYVSPSIAETIYRSSEDLPVGSRLSIEMIPTHAGWAWLGSPIRLPLIGDSGWTDAAFDGALHFRGFSWELQEVVTVDEEPTGVLNEVAISFYVERRDADRAIDFYSFLDWPFSEPWDGWDTSDGRVTASDMIGGHLRKFIYCFFAFLSQRIITSTPMRADRATRRRIAQWQGPDPLINVVELRRREHHPRDTDEHQDVEWSCQWIVRGHWHRYRTKDGLQPRWVAPYVKGPEDRPLKKPRAEVFAVIR